MTLFLARHGETVWHAENRYAGTTDVALTDLGRRQASDLGRWAAGHGVDSVHSSTLSRAVATAWPAADALGVEVRRDPRLVEVFFGEGEGLTGAEMDEAFADDAAAFRRHPAATPLPGGESGDSALERAWPALLEISRASAEGRALVVMHSTLMRLVLCRVIGLDTDQYRRAFPGVLNAAVTAVEIGERESSMLSYNVPVAAISQP